MTVNELVLAVRAQVDEDNTADISDSDVLRVLNRAQQKLVRLSARKYAPMFRRETSITCDGSTREIDIPESAFGLIVNEVDAIENGTAYKVEPAQLSQLTDYDTDSVATSFPMYYAQQGSKLKLYPTPKSGTVVRVRYQMRPPELVVSQGRITAKADNLLTLDALGSDLTTSISALKAFINLVDATTGTVKATLQVSAISTTNKTLTLKSSGLDRSVVFGQTVTTAVPSTVDVDDLVCIANGTCVPTLLRDYSDYLIQYSVVELKRKLGEPINDDLIALNGLEEDVKAMWAGREATLRVNKASPHWGRKAPLIYRYR